MRIGRMLTLVLAAAVALAGAAHAQTYSVFDVGKRTYLSVNAGGMVFFEEQTGAEGWKGVATGVAVTYSLHQLFSVFGSYDHGFPLNSSDGHENLLGVAGNLKVYPTPGQTSGTHMFVGGGILYFDQGATADWRGYEGHLVVNRQFKDGWGLFGKYTHGRSFEDGTPPLNLGKFGLQRKLFGAK